MWISWLLISRHCLGPPSSALLPFFFLGGGGRVPLLKQTKPTKEAVPTDSSLSNLDSCDRPLSW